MIRLAVNFSINLSFLFILLLSKLVLHMPQDNKKDGYRQRNVRQFLHILASPGYVPGTITVNVTWMERGFNACQTHVSIYLQPFTSYSEILVGNCNFFLPLAFNAPVGVFPLEFRGNVWSSKIRIMELPGSKDSLTIG